MIINRLVDINDNIFGLWAKNKTKTQKIFPLKKLLQIVFMITRPPHGEKIPLLSDFSPLTLWNFCEMASVQKFLPLQNPRRGLKKWIFQNERPSTREPPKNFMNQEMSEVNSTAAGCWCVDHISSVILINRLSELWRNQFRDLFNFKARKQPRLFLFTWTRLLAADSAPI